MTSYISLHPRATDEIFVRDALDSPTPYVTIRWKEDDVTIFLDRDSFRPLALAMEEVRRLLYRPSSSFQKGFDEGYISGHSAGVSDATAPPADPLMV